MQHEFATRSPDETMATMVDAPQVNHVPVLTGGVGRDQVPAFYATHFIPQMPPDLEVSPVSRTVGTERIVDEMVVRFTHTVRMDWMLPGVPPTGKPVEAAVVATVVSRDCNGAHARIHWHHASVQSQSGKPYL